MELEKEGKTRLDKPTEDKLFRGYLLGQESDTLSIKCEHTPRVNL